MSPRRTVLRWSPEGPHRPPADPRPLEERLGACARDRVGPADEVVRDAARELALWLAERAGIGAGPPESLAALLRRGLGPWTRAHAWRAPCARFLLRLEEGLGGPVDALAELLGREACAPPPDRRALVPFALRGMERAERVLVRGISETVALALEEAWRAGLAPEVLVGEGRPDLAGKRLARRLARRGLPVTVTYDAALPGRVVGVDRIWLGTEALGGGAFVGRVGDRTLLEAAREAGVPVELLALSDKLHPDGPPPLPAWDREEPFALWGDAPEGVTAEASFLERIESELLESWIHERGRGHIPQASTPVPEERALR